MGERLFKGEKLRGEPLSSTPQKGVLHLYGIADRACSKDRTVNVGNIYFLCT